MTELWTPTDELLEPADLEAQGVLLSDPVDHDANEVAACLVLASLDDDDIAGSETGETDDDEDLDDPADGEPVSDDV